MSATSDPYFDVEREVKQTVEGLHVLADRISQLESNGGGNPSDVAHARSELASALKTVNWDLDDINDSIQMIERNRAKYNLDDAEIARRRQFVSDTRSVVRRLKSDQRLRQPGHHQQYKNKLLSDQRSDRPMGSTFSSMDQGLEAGNAIHMEQQQLMLKQQDVALDDVIQATRALGEMGQTIGDELDQQSKLISQVTDEVDSTNNKIELAKERVERMLASQSEQRLMCLVCLLIGVFVALTTIVFYT